MQCQQEETERTGRRAAAKHPGQGKLGKSASHGSMTFCWFGAGLLARNPSLKRNQQRTKGKPSAAPRNQPTALEPGRRAGKRRWLFPLVALAVVPLFFLAVAEIALRVAGYGANSFFISWKTNAARFSSRMRDLGGVFPRHLAHPPLS